MNVWADTELRAELDRLTAELRDRTDAWVRQIEAVERDVYQRNSSGDKQT